jgi:hypothetical protein
MRRGTPTPAKPPQQAIGASLSLSFHLGGQIHQGHVQSGCNGPQRRPRRVCAPELDVRQRPRAEARTVGKRLLRFPTLLAQPAQHRSERRVRGLIPLWHSGETDRAGTATARALALPGLPTRVGGGTLGVPNEKRPGDVGASRGRPDLIRRSDTMKRKAPLILAVLVSLMLPAAAGAHQKHHNAKPAHHALRHHRAHKSAVEEATWAEWRIDMAEAGYPQEETEELEMTAVEEES